MENYFYSLKF